jgi:predicted aspartyl protease
VEIEGMSRSLILDTGSDISILQPGISKSNVSVTSLEPYGVTGDALDIRGQQTVNVVLNGREFTHSFLVCSLLTAAAGLIGTDLMKRLGTVIDSECGKMTLTNIDRVAQVCGAPPTQHSLSFPGVKQVVAFAPLNRRRDKRTDKSRMSPATRHTPEPGTATHRAVVLKSQQ